MLYICIPAYNEAPTIGVLLWRMRKPHRPGALIGDLVLPMLALTAHPVWETNDLGNEETKQKYPLVHDEASQDNPRAKRLGGLLLLMC